MHDLSMSELWFYRVRKMKKDGLYNNGQKVSEQNGDTLTYFYKNGAKKAEGKCINGQFEGKWLFFSEDGALLQEGNFNNNLKDGEWKRYSKTGELDYHEEFSGGKKVKKPKR